MSRSRLQIWLLLIPTTFTSGLVPATVGAETIFVDQNVSGSDDGSRWTDAHTDLQDALARASAGDEIWVAAGLYKPTSATEPSAAFQIENGACVYGSFPGS